VQGFNPQGVQPVVGVATVSEVTLQLRLVLFGLKTRETVIVENLLIWTATGL
jgi:hypothetical protein